MGGRGELPTIDLEEGTGARIEEEGVAVLDDDTGGLAPNFDDEGFGHGWISWSLATWPRSGDSTRAETAEVAPTRSKDPSCGVNVAMNSSALALRALRTHDDGMTTPQFLCRVTSRLLSANVVLWPSTSIARPSWVLPAPPCSAGWRLLNQRRGAACTSARFPPPAGCCPRSAAAPGGPSTPAPSPKTAPRSPRCSRGWLTPPARWSAGAPMIGAAPG